MALLEIENQESAEYLREQYGIKECPHTFASHYFNKNQLRVKFRYNTNDVTKSKCEGDPNSLLICRKCSLYNETEVSPDH